MSETRCSEEFKAETVEHVTERGYPVHEVARRLGISTHSLCAREKTYGHGAVFATDLDDHSGRSSGAWARDSSVSPKNQTA